MRLRHLAFLAALLAPMAAQAQTAMTGYVTGPAGQTISLTPTVQWLQSCNSGAGGIVGQGSCTAGGGGGGGGAVTAALGAFVDGALVTEGLKADAACASGATACTIEARLADIETKIASINTGVTISNASLAVTGTFWQTTQPVSIASVPLPTNAAQETGGNLAQVTVDLGAPGATACATDTGSCSTNQQLQRAIQRLTTLITTMGSPFQAGGSIGNTTFAVTNVGTFADQSTLQTQTDTTMVGGVNIKEINAVTPLMGAGATGTGSQRVTAAQDTTTIAGSAPGTAGTPSANVVSIQGVASGTTVPVTTSSAGATSNNGSTTITTGATFQTLLASNAARKGCLIQNPTTATEVLFVSVGIATGSATTAKSYTLNPGGSFSCASGNFVITDNIAVTATTTGHAFVETDQ